jgi:hypothetical protein
MPLIFCLVTKPGFKKLSLIVFNTLLSQCQKKSMASLKKCLPLNCFSSKTFSPQILHTLPLKLWPQLLQVCISVE